MVSVVKTTEDGGEAAATAATTATPTTLPRRHGDPMSNWSGREGGEAPSGPLYSLLHLRVWSPSESTVDTKRGQ